MTMRAVLLFVICQGAAATVPQFHINLDLPPFEQFKEVALRYREELRAIMWPFGLQIYSDLGERPRVEWMHMLHFDDSYKENIRGLVHYINFPEVTYTRLYLWNAVYELGSPAMCSGMLLAMPDGHVIQGRNMDYSYWFLFRGQRRTLTDITHEIIYSTKGRPFMRSTGWPGHVGMHTGMRIGPGTKWSFQVNSRKSNYDTNFKGALNGGLPHGILMRRLMEQVPDFERAKQEAWNLNLAAPCYIILAGDLPYQGVVMTLDPNKQHPNGPQAYSLKPPTMLGSGTWHLVQTNDDLSGPPQDIRRPTLEGMLDFHRQKDVNKNFALEQMRKPPIFNMATRFTTILIPFSSEYYSFLPKDATGFPDEPQRFSEVEGDHGWQRFLAPTDDNSTNLISPHSERFESGSVQKQDAINIGRNDMPLYNQNVNESDGSTGAGNLRGTVTNRADN